MKVIFVSHDLKVLRLISNEIIKNTDEHLFFSTLKDFLSDFDICFSNADLLVFEYNLIHTCKLLFFALLRKNERKIPLIFYDDPFADERNRVLYWVRRNESFFKSNSFDYLIPFFSDFNNCLDKLKIYPASGFREEKNQKGFEPPKSPRKELPPALSKIFFYFRQNCGKEVSVSDILRIDDDFASENTVYSYISRLRKYIRHENKFKIIRTGKSRYKLFEVRDNFL